MIVCSGVNTLPGDGQADPGNIAVGLGKGCADAGALKIVEGRDRK